MQDAPQHTRAGGSAERKKKWSTLLLTLAVLDAFPQRRHPMLSIPLKQTERVDLRRSLHAFVEASYSTEQADAHRDAFEEVHVLRERVRLATLTEKNHAATVATLARYYRVVTSLRTRFGAAVEDSEFAVQFVWRDAFRPPEKVARADLQYERVCVLFNVAAALSYAGAAQKRGDEEGLRRACQLFQQAAHAVESVQGLLADGGGGAGSEPDGRPVGGGARRVARADARAGAAVLLREGGAREDQARGARAAQFLARNSRNSLTPLPLSTRWWPRSPRRRQSTTARRRRR